MIAALITPLRRKAVSIVDRKRPRIPLIKQFLEGTAKLLGEWHGVHTVY